MKDNLINQALIATLKFITITLENVFKLPRCTEFIPARDRFEIAMRQIATRMILVETIGDTMSILEDRVNKLEEYAYRQELESVVRGEHFGNVHDQIVEEEAQEEMFKHLSISKYKEVGSLVFHAEIMVDMLKQHGVSSDIHTFQQLREIIHSITGRHMYESRIEYPDEIQHITGRNRIQNCELDVILHKAYVQWNDTTVSPDFYKILEELMVSYSKYVKERGL